MKKKTCVIISVIWTAMCLGLALLWCSELSHWGELSFNLKANIVLFALFMPFAWLVGLGKIWILNEG